MLTLAARSTGGSVTRQKKSGEIRHLMIMRALTSLATELGDAAFLLPASAVVAAVLFAAWSRRAALAWVSAIGLCAGLTILAKLAFHACGSDLPGLEIHSPSGHTSISTTFYACAALALAADRSWPTRLGLIVASAALVAGIAASRILIGAHTPEEVAAGLLLGLCCVLWFALIARSGPVHALRWQLPLLLLAGLGIAMHGHHLSVEGRIAWLADRLSLTQTVCPTSEAAALAPRGGGTLPPS